MDTGRIAKMIERYAGRDATGIDELDGPYIAKGISMDENSFERAEAGIAISNGYKPLIQLKLGHGPDAGGTETESLGHSYLDADGFSGSAYPLTKEEYSTIERMAA